jgi:hypothetical protein
MPSSRDHTQRPCRYGFLPWICGMAVVAAAASGCSTLGRPDWVEPGPEEKQRRRAVRFDPYLQNDIGPYQFRMPLMDGTRPRDYAEPVSEVKRSRWWSGGR